MINEIVSFEKFDSKYFQDVSRVLIVYRYLLNILLLNTITLAVELRIDKIISVDKIVREIIPVK